MFYDICYPENLCDPRRRMIKLLFYLFILYNKSHLSIYSKHTSILLLCNSKINHKCTERIPKMGSSPFIIGVAGGTASGKVSLSDSVVKVSFLSSHLFVPESLTVCRPIVAKNE